MSLDESRMTNKRGAVADGAGITRLKAIHENKGEVDDDGQDIRLLRRLTRHIAKPGEEYLKVFRGKSEKLEQPVKDVHVAMRRRKGLQ